MNDSKFSDKPRGCITESLKGAALLPYSGALVAGAEHEAYLRFLNYARPVAQGYDTVSLSRVRAAGSGGAPTRESAPPFLFVGRFVEKKNVLTLIDAYAHCRANFGAGIRDLVLVGDGPLRADIEQRIIQHGLGSSVELRGFLSSEDTARTMADAYCLLVPSTEDQWGLVVNEAQAFHLPVIASTTLGAANVLVRSGVNGLLVEPSNARGWSFAMNLIDRSEQLHAQFKLGAREIEALADVSQFVSGVETLLSPKS